MAISALVALLALAGWLLFPRNGGNEAGLHTLTGPAGNRFTIEYPPGWRPFSRSELDSLPGKPLALLRREGESVLVVRGEKRAPRDLETFSRRLAYELERRVPDFRKQRSRIVQTRAGRALYFPYVRNRAGSVHTIVIVPAGDRSYALNTVSPGGDDSVARQLAGMILSFSG